MHPKLLLSSICFLCLTDGFSQQLQLHYDLRHSLDPVHNAANYPTLFFEFFRQQDSGKSFIKAGSFLFKLQADLNGQQNNLGKAFLQVSQSLRFWHPKVFLALQYSGGSGVTEPRQYSYYISNAFSVGASHPFQWKGAWFNMALYYTYNAFRRPSHDLLYSFYWGKGFWNYKVEFAGDFEVYTLNKNQGDDLTKDLHGKWVAFFAEPQVWINVVEHFSVGTRLNLYYHVETFEDIFQGYPTVAVRFKF